MVARMNRSKRREKNGSKVVILYPRARPGRGDGSTALLFTTGGRGGLGGLHSGKTRGTLRETYGLWPFFPLFEHASFTFALSGVSRSLSHQLVRHRIASYSQRSQRYINESSFAVVIPPTVEADPVAKDEFKRVIRQIREGYHRLTALGIPKEDARYLLPNACQTQLIMTMNARSLLHFMALRCCRRAQWEIREFAWKLRAEVMKVAPLLFWEAGPPCLVRGECPEGPMSCGQPYTKEEANAGDHPQA